MFAKFDPTHNEDGPPISVRASRKSWRTYVLCGLVPGLILVTMPLLFGTKHPALKYQAVQFGVLWMIFWAALAWYNLGRKVLCDMESITLSQIFGPKRVALSDVASLTREDLTKRMRELRDKQLPQDQRRKGLDTMAPIVRYVLRDAQGRTLMRLDQGMEPADEMERLLRRLEQHAGQVREA